MFRRTCSNSSARFRRTSASSAGIQQWTAVAPPGSGGWGFNSPRGLDFHAITITTPGPDFRLMAQFPGWCPVDAPVGDMIAIAAARNLFAASRRHALIVRLGPCSPNTIICKRGQGQCRDHQATGRAMTQGPERRHGTDVSPLSCRSWPRAAGVRRSSFRSQTTIVRPPRAGRSTADSIAAVSARSTASGFARGQKRSPRVWPSCSTELCVGRRRRRPGAAFASVLGG